jgi:23S rRNA (adenine2030-N6)-methyltransferase
MRASAIRDIIAIEMHLRAVTSADRLNGCGLLVIHPPFGFQDQALVLAEAVLDGLGAKQPGAGIVSVRLTDE